MPSLWQRIKTSISPVRSPIFAAAPTQKVRMDIAGRRSSPPSYTSDPEKSGAQISVTIISDPEELTTKKKLNVFDKITRLAGSSEVFFIMMALIAVWVLLGIIYGTTDTWQIIMQNASSIQVYVTDILLIRQQQNASRSLMTTLAEIQSRNKTCERLLRQIPGCQWMETHKDDPKELLVNGRPVEDEVEENLYMVNGRPSRFQYVWTKTCHAVSTVLGSLWAFIFYWIGILVWVGIGKLYDFSDTWQLYINTAVAVVLTFTSVFLQNIQQQQEDSLEKCLEYALKIDAEVEHRLRELTEDFKPNPIFEIAPPPRGRLERYIDNFADAMGSMLGVVISVVFTIAWVAVGPLLQFDDNWVLIIGTFTGLVGFIDGFVLRNLYCREEKIVGDEFNRIAWSDRKVLDLLNVEVPEKTMGKRKMDTRISIATGDALGSTAVSVGAVGFVILLLVIASAMQWSTTGQLLCNTPTMIIEGFLLLVLIQAHNIANEERGVEFNGVLKRRLLLNSYVHSLDGYM
ncbi:Low-affinity iron/zinc ion transport protein fet4 [Lachnellula suecica]|uniref:Low-affinity iron/zinc ion transport protein fet4 n=1 Tax=Lachnellula suecica TaxID=602035 RepID=A0A8T9C0M5_9HELO|nr:Low-affinity iron/zinc ion transport protein fet4 [Lachnellula suecica]